MQLLVWIFVMRVAMLVSSSGAYFLNGAIAQAKYANSDEMDFEAPLTSLVWITSIVSIILTFIVSYLHDPHSRRRNALVEAGFHHLLRNPGGRDHPRIGQGLHFNQVGPRAGSRHLRAGRRSFPGNPVGIRGRQFLGLLAGTEHGRAHGTGLFLQYRAIHGCPDARSSRLRLWPGRLRLPGHGSGHDCRGFLRPGHRQCSIGLRVVADRNDSRHRSRVEEGLRHRREVRTRQAPAGSQ